MKARVKGKLKEFGPEFWAVIGSMPDFRRPPQMRKQAIRVDLRGRSRIEYHFEIHPLSKGEGGGYAITFPDFPGCRSDGATPEEAVKNGRDALKSWLSVAREFGDFRVS